MKLYRMCNRYFHEHHHLLYIKSTVEFKNTTEVISLGFRETQWKSLLDLKIFQKEWEKK